MYYCLKSLLLSKVSQFGATHICQLFGMELISIQNQTKNEDILNKIQQKGIKGKA